jgi:hypothetical protein
VEGSAPSLNFGLNFGFNFEYSLSTAVAGTTALPTALTIQHVGRYSSVGCLTR